MSTNRWLNTINNLKTTTDALRNNLISGGVEAKPEDTLDMLVAKVPSLAPRIVTQITKWEPDALWVFPDPNGSGQKKTIRQIYDEDPMAETYTYRGIYMIYGTDDAIDLKAVMSKRTSADTFITSDGITYSDITETSLTHNWNKEYDVVDSNGNVVRYVKIYSKSTCSYVPGFYGRLVWGVHNLGALTTSNSSSNYTISDTNYPCYLCYSTLIECLEFGEKVTRLNAHPALIGYPKKIRMAYGGTYDTMFPPAYKNGSSYTQLTDGLARVMDYEFDNIKTFDNCYNYNYVLCGAVKNLKFPSTLTSFTLRQELMQCLEYIDFTECTKLTSIAITTGSAYLYSHSSYPTYFMSYRSPIFEIPDSVTSLSVSGGDYTSLSLPLGLKTLSLYRCPIRALAIPETCTSITLAYLPLEEITIPTEYGQVDTTSSFSLANLYNLRRINLPVDYNRTSNFTCRLLEHENILEILTNLKDLTGKTAKTLTLGSINLAKLSDEEKAIATNKNWTLA